MVVGGLRDADGQNAGEPEVELASTDVAEPCRLEVLVDGCPGGVKNVFLDAADDDVKHDPSDHVVAEPVDQQKPASGPEHAPHLPNHILLMRVVVERVAARDHVEGRVPKRQLLEASVPTARTRSGFESITF